MTALAMQQIDTPDGPFIIIENGAGEVMASGWTADAAGLAARSGLRGAELRPGEVSANEAVRAYYSGDLDAPFVVPVVWSGTEFQSRVWDVLRTIPTGEIRRYGELAAQLGSPGASRAVGAACGANRVALFVPCHRVVGASGALTGFAWGTDVKRALLQREGAVDATLL